MGLTISEHVLNTNYWITCLRSLLCALVERLFDSRNVFVGNILSLSFIYKLARKICIRASCILVNRLQITCNSGELTSTTRLFLVEEIKVCLVRNCFSVVDSRISNLEINVIFTLHSLTIDEKMKFSHARDNDFFAFHVLLNYKSRIFTSKPIECLQEDFKLIWFLRLHSQWHNWIRNVHFLHGPVDCLITESFSRSAINTKDCKNISSSCLIDILHFSGMHADHSADLYFLFSSGVV